MLARWLRHVESKKHWCAKTPKSRVPVGDPGGGRRHNPPPAAPRGSLSTSTQRKWKGVIRAAVAVGLRGALLLISSANRLRRCVVLLANPPALGA